jgi:hypothetical protein
MAKFKKIEEIDFDFDFSKIPQKVPNYFFELFFILSFVFLFLVAPRFQSNNEYPIQYEPFGSLVMVTEESNETQIQDEQFFNTQKDFSPINKNYVITSENIKMFQNIFEYNSKSSLSSNQDIRFFQELIRNNDLLNSSFDKNQKIIVSSSILAIEPADKNFIIKYGGYPDFDYVDLIVQKNYTQNNNFYFEQQMVNVVLYKDKIVSLNIHKII